MKEAVLLFKDLREVFEQRPGVLVHPYEAAVGVIGLLAMRLVSRSWEGKLPSGGDIFLFFLAANLPIMWWRKCGFNLMLA